MDGSTFIPGLFGRETETVRLIHPVEALTAVLRNDRMATCAGIAVISDTPIQALCGALAASHPDSAMQVRDRRGNAVMFVQSVHAAARASAA